MLAEITIDPVVLGSLLMSILLAGWGAYERWRNSKTKQHQILVEAEQRLTGLYKEESEAWKNRFDNEHKEYTEARKKYHDDRNEWGSKNGALQEQVVSLTAKTDVTSIIEFQKQQSEINKEILSALQHIIIKLEKTLS